MLRTFRYRYMQTEINQALTHCSMFWNVSAHLHIDQIPITTWRLFLDDNQPQTAGGRGGGLLIKQTINEYSSYHIWSSYFLVYNLGYTQVLLQWCNVRQVLQLNFHCCNECFIKDFTTLSHRFVRKFHFKIHSKSI